MARTKGTLSLSSNIEPSMNAPLDARLVVNTVADLTASGSFPYFYEGMVVSCKENRKLYQLVGNDPTAPANWSEVGSGGGSDTFVFTITGTVNDLVKNADVTNLSDKSISDIKSAIDGGKTVMCKLVVLDSISNPRISQSYILSYVTEYDVFNQGWYYYSFMLSGDNKNTTILVNGQNGTIVMQTDLVADEPYASASNAGIVKVGSGLSIDSNGALSVSADVDYSNMGAEAFQFSASEKVIGTWVDGKPLYQRSFTGTLPEQSSNEWYVNVGASIDSVADINVLTASSGGQWRKWDYFVDNHWLQCGVNNNSNVDHPNTLRIKNEAWAGAPYYITIRYTKTTDSAIASGEKIVGQWIDGSVLYQKTFTYTTPISVSNVPLTTVIGDTSALHIDKLVKLNGTMIWADSLYAIPFCRVGLNGYALEATPFIDGNSGELRITVWRDSGTATISELSITIQYTKTSS